MQRLTYILLLVLLPFTVWGGQRLSLTEINDMPGREIVWSSDGLLLAQVIEPSPNSTEDSTKHYSTLVLYDITDPYRVKVAGEYLQREYASVVDCYLTNVKAQAVVSGDLLYAVLQNYGAGCAGYAIETPTLYIVRLSDGEILWSKTFPKTPDNPIFDPDFGGLYQEMWLTPQGMVLRDNVLYAGLGAWGVFAIDVTDPANAVIHANLAVSTFDIGIHDNQLVYSWCDIDSNKWGMLFNLSVADISDPLDPKPITTITVDEPVEQIGSALHNGYFYHTPYQVGRKTNAMVIYQVDASGLRLVATPLVEQSKYRQVDVADGYLYIKDRETLGVYDISRPADPFQIASVYDIGLDGTMAIVGDYLYITGDPIVVLSVGYPESVSPTKPAELPSLLTLQPLYPNPFNATTSVGWTTGQSGTAVVSLVDNSGRIGYSTSVYSGIGLNKHSLILTNVPAGSYWLSVRLNGEVRSQRAVLMK